MVELQWGDNYPAEKPTVNMDTFYNRNVYGDRHISTKYIRVCDNNGFIFTVCLV